MDFSEVETRITRFIKEYVSNSHAKGVVLGLSGGIDSATIAALCSKALGSENVLALLSSGEGKQETKKTSTTPKPLQN